MCRDRINFALLRSSDKGVRGTLSFHCIRWVPTLHPHAPRPSAPVLFTHTTWHHLSFPLVVLTMTPLHRLGHILVFSVISGYIDVVSLVIFGVFTGFMSGNIIHLGMSLADVGDVAKTKSVEYYIVPIALYFASALLGQWAVTSFPRWGPWAVSVLAAAGCAFPAVFYAVSDGDASFWCALPLSPSLALQTIWTNKHLGIMTTMGTGTLQTLAMALAPLLRCKPVSLKPDGKVLPPLTGIAGLCLGSVLGGWVLAGGTRNLFVLLLPVAFVQLSLLLVLTGRVQKDTAAAQRLAAKADPAAGSAGGVADVGQTGARAKEDVALQALETETLEVKVLHPSPGFDSADPEHMWATGPPRVPGEDGPERQPIGRSSSGIIVHVIEEGLGALSGPASASMGAPPAVSRPDPPLKCGGGVGGTGRDKGKGGDVEAEGGRGTKRGESGEAEADRPNVLANIIRSSTHPPTQTGAPVLRPPSAEDIDGARGAPLRGISVAYLTSHFLELFECQLKEKPDAKVYNIEPRIRKLTAGTPCPRTTDGPPCPQGCAFVDWVPDEFCGKAVIMLSYGWGYEVRQIVDALGRYCTQRGRDPRRVFVWICCLCINQHRVKGCAGAVPFAEFRKAFGDRVAGVGHVVALLSPWDKPLYLTRVWCVFECYEAAMNPDIEFEIILPSSDAELLKEAVSTSDSMADVWRRLSSLSIQDAQASVPADRENIFRLIEEGPGFAKVNGQVAIRIGNWVSEVCRKMVADAECKFGFTDEGTLTSVSNLAELLRVQGKLSEAEPLCLRALEGREATLGPMHASTLTSVHNLAMLLQDQGKLSEAEPLCRRALEGREATLGPMHADTLTSANNLALLLQDQGKLSEAEPLCRRALEGREATLGPMHASTLTSANNLAMLLQDQGKLSEAEPLCRRALEGSEATLGPMHADTLTSANNLALLLQDQGKLSEAEPLCRRALEGSEATLGPMHAATLASANNLALLLQDQGKLSEAEPLCRWALEGREATLGPMHAFTLTSANNLAMLLRAQGKLSEAEPLCRRALEGIEATLGPMHADTLTLVNNLALLLQDQGRLSEAEPLYRRALEGREATLGPMHADTLTSVHNLAALLQVQGKLSEAEPLCRRALEGSEATLGPMHADTLASANNLALLLQDQGKLSEAEPLCRRALEGREATLGPMHASALTSVNNLAGLLQDQGNLSEAEPLYRRALEGREATLGPMHADTLTSVHNLAGLLQDQDKLNEAEPLLLRLAGPP